MLLKDKGVIRSSTPAPAPEINTIDDRESLAPPNNPSTSPPPSPSLCQTKTEPDTTTPSLTGPVTIEIDADGALVDELSITPPALLEPKVEPDTIQCLPANHDTPKDIHDEIVAVEAPPAPVVPRKRLREPTPAGAIDVDMLSSDDEIVVLEMKAPKAIKRARVVKCECRAIKREDEDVKPKIESIKHENEDIKPRGILGHSHSESYNSVLDLWRLGC